LPPVLDGRLQSSYVFKVWVLSLIILPPEIKVHFQNDFASGHVSGELPVSPLVLSLSLFFSLSVFLCFFVWSLLWGLLLATSMAESSCCFRNCSRYSVRRMLLVTGLYPL
jgi:hypothetical protein